MLGARRGLAKLVSRGAGVGQCQIPALALQRRLPKPAGWVSPSWLSGFFPSWRAGKRIRGIPKGREEEDSGAFQPLRAFFKTELFIQALASVAEGYPPFPPFKASLFKERKKGKKAACCLALSATGVPQIPSQAKPAGSHPLLLVPANPMGRASGAYTARAPV